MDIAKLTIQNKLISVIIICLTIAFGFSSYQNMARFEDPEFIIRTAQIFVPYPGASPLEVAEEVTERLERALQELQEVDSISSTSSAGKSEIKVDIKSEFSKTKSELQIIWTKLRNKINDAKSSLPPGVGTPVVFDDFGDVYGLSYLLTAEGYSPDELHAYAKNLQGDILQVEGVAKVAMTGVQQEGIFVEIAREEVAALGVSINNIYSILDKQNTMVSAGNTQIGEQRVFIDLTGEIDSVDTIKNLLISASGDGKAIYLKDIANVYRGFQSPTTKLVRYNSKPAISLGVASVLGTNVVKVFERVDAKIIEAESRRPIGINIHEYYHQGEVVQASVDNFVVNVIVALIIVMVTLLIFMGLNSGIVIGSVLLLTIFATLATMDASGIPMHRISLGALIIALGMMVDNAIVVTEGMLVGIKKGQKKLAVATEVVKQTKWPLLGGTLVGIVAFAPIGLAPGDTAEFTGHLFWVILISLLYSWLFAVTLTPLFCYMLFKQDKNAEQSQEKPNKLISGYQSLITAALHHRWLTVAIVIGMFATSMWGFKFVKSGFFPASTTPQMVVDFWLPEGTDIEKTKKNMLQLEAYIQKLEGVEGVQTLIGGGGLRFMLIYGSESPNSSYGQILTKVDDYKKLDAMLPQVQNYIDQSFPDAQGKVWRFVMGPGGGSKIEATFKGPKPSVLRELAEQAKAIMVRDGGALSIKDTWRQQVRVIEPQYSPVNAQRAGVDRKSVSDALQKNFTGQTVGLYREGDELIPIIVRAPAKERLQITDISNIQVLSQLTGKTVPLAQVTDGFKTIWRDGILKREDRIWTIKAQSDPVSGQLASEVFNRIRPQIEAIALPDGYTLEWDGEYGQSKESNEMLASTIPLGLLAMVLIVVVLFNAIKQPIIIWLVVPLALIGVVVGLVTTQIPLEFMGILGLLSLSGLLIKNAIVLVDQMDMEIRSGKARFDAVVDSANSRMRPVMMGTLTTVLGVIPLYFDAFFQSMAVVLVFGLLFATLLTLILIPVLYTIFMKISPQEIAE
ncbi:efflux RND transporter permease subunit [Cognaticolwellia beringensis]|uniref:AcrB/AcrD/AcrF family protein n=1 Tax=Cognaticolwellia beringensis TaxID=1967665 RepID=A0A222G8V7_9GAMM|nr:efflux RND transporter permease subunit [Cognaticolwellia beringensis]ASP48307.1 AcrB/AcrD/AcrF family protein [Cognaticolwellia beringensis]